MNIKYYDQEGNEIGELDLDERIFGVDFNMDLIHQVIISMMSNKRTPIAHAKGRAEVRGGGKKPWRQKGTGHARHGSIRSPIWIGGGVTHGPTKEKNYKKKINKKMGKKALFSALSKKLKDNEIIFLDRLEISNIKTAEARKILEKIRQNIKGFEKLGIKGGKALISNKNTDKNTSLSFRNLPYIETKEIRNLNVLDILQNKYLIITKEAAENIK